MSDSEATPSWAGQVFPHPYPDMMRQHLFRAADRVLRRQMPIYSLRSWEVRREQIRAQLVHALGGFPERTALNPQVTSTHQRDGYRIENVAFESRPGFYVTASVFVPDGLTGPAPAILSPHGHWPLGRFQEPVQRRMVGLARRGYVVLSLDAVGYNDREPMGHRRSWYLFAAGQTLQGVQLWDNIRAIDYLCSREDVDPERIGCTGCSGGGNQTMYVSALDERIKVSVPVCSVEIVSDYMEKGFCTCETIPGLVGIADLTEITAMIAPRALLLIHGILDRGFPILSARLAADRIAEVYGLYDPSRFATFESYDEHAYNEEMRRAMYAWFDRWLMGQHETESHAAMGTEGGEEAPGEDNLRVFPAGLPAGAIGLADLFAARIECLPEMPEPEDAQGVRQRQQSLTEGLWQILGGRPLDAPLDVRPVAQEQREGYRLERFWFRSEPDIVLPAVLARPDSGKAPDVYLYLLEGGKEALPEAEAHSRLQQGHAIYAFDPRGVGETKPDRDHDFLSALALGRPLTGMRAWDTMRSVSYLLGRKDIGRVHLVARGSLATSMTGLLTAALDRRIASAILEALPTTLRLPFAAEEMDPLYLPGLLLEADVPDILGMVAPRPLRLERVLDQGLQPLPSDQARAALAAALRSYRLLGAPEALTLVT